MIKNREFISMFAPSFESSKSYPMLEWGTRLTKDMNPSYAFKQFIRKCAKSGSPHLASGISIVIYDFPNSRDMTILSYEDTLKSLGMLPNAPSIFVRYGTDGSHEFINELKANEHNYTFNVIYDCSDSFETVPDIRAEWIERVLSNEGTNNLSVSYWKFTGPRDVLSTDTLTRWATAVQRSGRRKIARALRNVGAIGKIVKPLQVKRSFSYFSMMAHNHVTFVFDFPGAPTEHEPSLIDYEKTTESYKQLFGHIDSDTDMLMHGQALMLSPTTSEEEAFIANTDSIITDAKNIRKIWETFYSGMNASLLAPDEMNAIFDDCSDNEWEAHLSLMTKIANTLGIYEAVDAYFSGCDIEDILA